MLSFLLFIHRNQYKTNNALKGSEMIEDRQGSPNLLGLLAGLVTIPVLFGLAASILWMLWKLWMFLIYA
jgi:phosphatidylglycerophosphate synthase